MLGLLVPKHVELEGNLNSEQYRHTRLTVALLAMQTIMLQNKTATLNLVLGQVHVTLFSVIALQLCVLLDYTGMNLEYAICE